MEQATSLRRSIGLIETVAIVVGAVIGMGIFVLVGSMAALAGKTLWLAFLIAIGLSFVSALPLIQLASALPRAGGGYFFVSRMFSPYFGVLTSNWGILGGVCSSALVTKGLAAYLIGLTGIDFPPDLFGVFILLLLYLVYRFGLRLAARIQVLLVVQLILALGVYVFYGASSSGVALSFAIPRGYGNFFMAIVLAYSLSMGAQVLAEIGEEVRNASRNIPLALLLGGLIIVLVYILVSGVFLSTIPYGYEKYETLQAPLAQSAEVFLNPFWLLFLNIAAVSAGLTSLNAAASSLPRELFAQARDGLLPEWFAKIHLPTGTPMNAVSSYCLLAAFLTISPLTVTFFGYMVAIGIMMLSIPVSLAALLLPEKYPERYKNAYVRFPVAVLILCVLLAVLCSGGFIILIALEAPFVLLIYVVWTVVISIGYFYRKQKLAQQGVSLIKIANEIPGYDE